MVGAFAPAASKKQWAEGKAAGRQPMRLQYLPDWLSQESCLPSSLNFWDILHGFLNSTIGQVQVDHLT